MTLQAHQLTCTRGERPLFERLDLRVGPGQALWLAGPNGSGKTSLLRLLAGLAQPSEGEVRWQGTRIERQRERFHRALLWCGHASGSTDELDAVEHLRHTARLRGHGCSEREALAALEHFGLAGVPDLPARALSQGQRKRIGLARLALAPRPALVVLDEPFTALDSAAVAHLTALLNDLLAAGASVVYTTHQPQALHAPGGLLHLALGEHHEVAC
jgi:heme exporter protein A